MLILSEIGETRCQFTPNLAPHQTPKLPIAPMVARPAVSHPLAPIAQISNLF